MPYNPTVPVIVTDEQPVRLFKETRTPIPATIHHSRRVDFQVMVDVSVNDFAQLFLDDHAVTKFRKGGFHFNQTQKNGINVQTLTFGSISKVELCIYDKRHELQSKKSSLIKQQLFIEKCIGYDWWNSDKPITRIEFRLGREALKCLGVDSVTDLQECEKSILDLITKEWFRILESPKIRGHENKAAVHPLWERVRSLFFQYFSGTDVSEVKWDAQRSVSCDPQALEKQALGCLSKAFSCRHGKQNDLISVTKTGCDRIEKVREDLYEKVNIFSEYVRMSTGIQLGGSLSVSSSLYDDPLADGIAERTREKYLERILKTIFVLLILSFLCYNVVLRRCNNDRLSHIRRSLGTYPAAHFQTC